MTSPALKQTPIVNRDRWFAAVIRIAKYRLRSVADDLEITARAIDAGIINEDGAVALLEASGLLCIIDEVLRDMEQPT